MEGRSKNFFWNQQEDWSGRGDSNAQPPAPKGAKSAPGGLSGFANPNGYNNPGNLLSLKKEVHRMERIEFGHSFGTVEKQARDASVLSFTCDLRDQMH